MRQTTVENKRLTQLLKECQVDNEWRPEGWENPYIKDVPKDNRIVACEGMRYDAECAELILAYEAGASALFEKLAGMSNISLGKWVYISKTMRDRYKLVFIPNKEKK